MNKIIELLSKLDTLETFSIIMLLLIGSFILIFASFNNPLSKDEIIIKKLEKKEQKGKNNIMSRISDGSLTGKLIAMSYAIPFKWFVDNTESSKQAITIKQKIIDAQMYHTFTYRSFMVVKFIFAAMSLLLMVVFLLLLQYAPVLFPILKLTSNSLLEAKIFILIFVAILAIYPSLMLSSTAKSVKTQRTKDLPILQLFLILSLRTGKSIREIFKTLGNLNTRYKATFRKAFLIYLRSGKECFEYLMEEFKDTRFEFTIRALSNMEYYSIEDTITLLENSLEDIIAENKNKEEKKNLINLFVTQGTLILPLAALGLLILYPVLSYIVGILGNTTF